MKLGVIADDFTGASDIALALTEAGMPTEQYIGVPESEAVDAVVMAGVIALKSRNVEADKAIEQSISAAHWLLKQGVEQIVFKICSTFDSTEKGNIGPVTEALANLLGVQKVLVCPAYPGTGRTVYQGHLFVGENLLNESGMENHPLTPMTDADIRRVLQKQSTWPVTAIGLEILRGSSQSLNKNLESKPSSLIVIDAVNDIDLKKIGKIAKGMKLITGSAGVAQSLPANMGVRRMPRLWNGTKERGVIFSGSCSETTREQIAHYQIRHPSLKVDVKGLLARKLDVDDLVDWVMSRDIDQPGLIYTSADPDEVAALQDRHGVSEVANLIESMFESLAIKLQDKGVKRFVIAGGETSGAVTSALQVKVLETGPRIAAGVPAMKVADSDIFLALKSGNFGKCDFFVTAVKVLGST